MSTEQIHNIYDSVASFMHTCVVYILDCGRNISSKVYIYDVIHTDRKQRGRGVGCKFTAGPSSILHLFLIHLLLSLETMWKTLLRLPQRGNEPVTAAYGSVVQDTHLLIVWKMSSHFILIKFTSQPISPPLYTQFTLVFPSFCITFMIYYIMRPIQVPHSERIAII